MNVNDEYLRCRALGHAWDDDVARPAWLARPLFGWQECARCIRCSTYRIFIIDTNGAVASRRYLYPDGYAMAPGEGMSRPEIRSYLHKKERRKAKSRRTFTEDELHSLAQ